MYGVETLVHPDCQGFGIGGLLMQHRFDTARKLNLRGIIAGSLIMDYHKVADEMTVEQYVAAVMDGRLFDTNLSKQMKKGFVPINLIPNYTTYPLSHDYGVAIRWTNSAYHKPTGKVIRFASTGQPARSAVGS